MRAQLKDRIRKAVEPLLAQLGFTYGGKPEPRSWRFVRRSGSVDQFITFEKSYFEADSLRVNLKTSQDMAGVELRLIADGIPGPMKTGWWTYHDDESLDRVLIELAELIVKFGIPWLENNGGPLLWPSEKHSRDLLVNPQGRANGLATRLGLSIEDESSLVTIEEQLLKGYAEVQGQPDWDLMLDCAAFTGELIRRQFGGEWAWDAKLGTAVILGIGGRPSLVAAPLSMVAAFWSKRDRLRSLPGGPEFLRTVLLPPGVTPVRH